MTRKRSVHPFRAVLVILIIMVLALIIFFGVKLIISKTGSIDENSKDDIEQKEEVNEDAKVKLSIDDYVVYIDDDGSLGFNFVIADIRIKSNVSPFTFELNELSTAERVELGNISSYEEKMKSVGYDLSKLSYTTTDIYSENNEEVVSLLIPYMNVKGELSVYNGEVLKFDLSHNNKKASDLKLSDEVQKTVVDSDDYSLEILDAYIEDMMFVNGEEYTHASTVDVYAFIINVKDVNNKSLVVEKAKYVPLNTSIEIEAMGKEYSSVFSDNIIGRKLKAGDQYSLFFSITNPTNEKATFEGKVYIKFENDSNWLEIQTKHD